MNNQSPVLGCIWLGRWDVLICEHLYIFVNFSSSIYFFFFKVCFIYILPTKLQLSIYEIKPNKKCVIKNTKYNMQLTRTNNLITEIKILFTDDIIKVYYSSSTLLLRVNLISSLLKTRIFFKVSAVFWEIKITILMFSEIV